MCSEPVRLVAHADARRWANDVSKTCTHTAGKHTTCAVLAQLVHCMVGCTACTARHVPFMAQHAMHRTAPVCIRQSGCKCRHEALHMPKCFIWHLAVLAVSVTMRRQLMRTCRCKASRATPVATMFHGRKSSKSHLKTRDGLLCSCCTRHVAWLRDCLPAKLAAFQVHFAGPQMPLAGARRSSNHAR